MTPSPAADGCLVYFGPLFIPSCSCRRSPVGRTPRSTRLFLCYSGSWMCSEPVHQLPSIRHAPWDDRVVFETDATSSWIQQQLWQSVCRLVRWARKNRIPLLLQAAEFFHDLSDKMQPSYFCCFAEQWFFFLIDVPKLKLLRQTDRKKGPPYIQMQSDVQHAILKFCGFIPHIHLAMSNNWFVHYSL